MAGLIGVLLNKWVIMAALFLIIWFGGLSDLVFSNPVIIIFLILAVFVVGRSK